MKHSNLKLLSCVIVCAGIFSSCSNKEIQTGNKTESVISEMKFTAIQNNISSRTSLDDTDVKWTKGNKINIFTDPTEEYGNSFEFTTYNITENNTAIFTGETITGSSAYYALYPYSENATCTGNVISTTLPSEQTAIAGTFADGMNISACKAEANNTLQFKNACSIIKFNITDGEAENIMLSSDVPIAGAFNITVNDDKSLTTEINGNELSVSLSGTMTKDNSYFMVLPAKTITNLKLTVDGSEVILKKGETTLTELQTNIGKILTINLDATNYVATQPVNVGIIGYKGLLSNYPDDADHTIFNQVVQLELTNEVKINAEEKDRILGMLKITATNNDETHNITVDNVELDANDSKKLVLTLNIGTHIYYDDIVTVNYDGTGRDYIATVDGNAPVIISGEIKEFEKTIVNQDFENMSLLSEFINVKAGNCILMHDEATNNKYLKFNNITGETNTGSAIQIKPIQYHSPNSECILTFKGYTNQKNPYFILTPTIWQTTYKKLLDVSDTFNEHAYTIKLNSSRILIHDDIETEYTFDQIKFSYYYFNATITSCIDDVKLVERIYRHIEDTNPTDNEFNSTHEEFKNDTDSPWATNQY